MHYSDHISLIICASSRAGLLGYVLNCNSWNTMIVFHEL